MGENADGNESFDGALERATPEGRFFFLQASWMAVSVLTFHHEVIRRDCQTVQTYVYKVCPRAEGRRGVQTTMSLEFLLTSLIVVASPGTGVIVTLAAGLSRGCVSDLHGVDDIEGTRNIEGEC